MDHVAGGDGVDHAGVVTHLELPVHAEADGLALEHTVAHQRHPHPPPEGDEQLAMGPFGGDRVVERGGELGEERVEQRFPVDRVAGFEVAGRRRGGELGRERLPVHVDAQPHYQGVALVLGQDAGELAVPHHYVVGPLHPGVDARDRAYGPGQRHRGGDDRLMGFVGPAVRRRAEQHRDQQGRPRRGLPGAVEAPAAGRLVVGDDDQTFRGALPGPVERPPVRGVELLEVTHPPAGACGGAVRSVYTSRHGRRIRRPNARDIRTETAEDPCSPRF